MVRVDRCSSLCKPPPAGTSDGCRRLAEGPAKRAEMCVPVCTRGEKVDSGGGRHGEGHRGRLAVVPNVTLQNFFALRHQFRDLYIRTEYLSVQSPASILSTDISTAQLLLHQLCLYVYIVRNTYPCCDNIPYLRNKDLCGVDWGHYTEMLRAVRLTRVVPSSMQVAGLILCEDVNRGDCSIYYGDERISYVTSEARHISLGRKDEINEYMPSLGSTACVIEGSHRSLARYCQKSSKPISEYFTVPLD